MAYTLPTGWAAASRRDGARPIYYVKIEPDASTAYEMLSGDRNLLGYPLCVNEVTPIASSIHPITRESEIGGFTITLKNDLYVRNMINTEFLRGKKVTVTYGFGGHATALSDFAGGTVGVIKRAYQRKNEIIVECLTVKRLLLDRRFEGEYRGRHPLQLASDLVLNDAGVDSGLVDSTSLDPDTYASGTNPMSHWSMSLGLPTHFAGEEQLPTVEELISEIGQLVDGGFFENEDGKFQFGVYDPSASIQSTWTEGENLIEFEVVEDGDVFNDMVFGLVWSRSVDEFVLKIRHTNTDSTGNFAFPGASDQSFEKTWRSKILVSESRLDTGTAFDSTDTTFILDGGDLCGFAGCRNDSGTGRTLTSSRPAYILLSGGTKNEIIECSSVTLDTNHLDEDGKIIRAEFTVATNGRDFAGGGSSTGADFSSVTGSVRAFDVTIPVEMLRRRMERFSSGDFAIARAVTPISEYGVQLTDLVGIVSNNYIGKGTDGLDGTQKWEVIRKEADHRRGIITWLIARATSTTGYTEDWEPKLADGDIIFNPIPKIPDLDPWWNNSDIIDKVVMRDLLVTDVVNLDINIPGGEWAGAEGLKGKVASTDYTVTASRDTYVGIDSVTRKATFRDVANAAGAPSVGPTETRLAKIEADSSSVTANTDLRKFGPSFLAPENLGAENVIVNGSFSYITQNPPGLGQNGALKLSGVTLDGSTNKSGSNSLQISVGLSTAPEVRLGPYAVAESEPYHCMAEFQASSIASLRNVRIYVDWYQEDKETLVSTTTIRDAVAAAANTWEVEGQTVNAPTNARWAFVRVTGRAVGVGYTINYDRVQFSRAQHAFHAHRNGSDAVYGSSGWNRIDCTTEDWDHGSVFNATGSGTNPRAFTCRKPGRHRFRLTAYSEDNHADFQVAFRVNGTEVKKTRLFISTWNVVSGQLSAELLLSAADYVEPWVSSDLSSWTLGGSDNLTFFEGCGPLDPMS